MTEPQRETPLTHDELTLRPVVVSAAELKQMIETDWAGRSPALQRALVHRLAKLEGDQYPPIDCHGCGMCIREQDSSFGYCASCLDTYGDLD